MIGKERCYYHFIHHPHSGSTLLGTATAQYIPRLMEHTGTEMLEDTTNNTCRYTDILTSLLVRVINYGAVDIQS